MLAPSAASASDAQPLLRVEDMTLAFGGVKALSGVSFEVAAGSITAASTPSRARTSGDNLISFSLRAKTPPPLEISFAS